MYLCSLNEYSQRAKFSLAGIAVIGFVSRLGLYLEILMDKDIGAYPYWVFITCVMIGSISLPWITDNYMGRYMIAKLCVVAVVCHAVFLFMTHFLTNVPAKVFYTFGFCMHVFHISSIGILHSILIEQVEFDENPEYEAVIRKYILYYIFCWNTGKASSSLLMLASFVVIVTLAVIFIILTIAFLVLMVFNIVDFYRGDYHFNALYNCLESIFMKNLSIMIPTVHDIDRRDENAIQFLLVVSIVTIVGLFYSLSAMLFTGRYLVKTYLLERFLPPIAIYGITWFILMPTFEFIVVPIIQKRTILKKSIHQFVPSFMLMSLVIFVTAISQFHFENSTFGHSLASGYAQMRFFSGIENDITLTIEHTSLIVQSFGLGSFLRIPVKEKDVKTVQITEPNRTFYAQLEIQELTSHSYIVYHDRVEPAPLEDPLQNLETLEKGNSYFYALFRSTLNANLTFKNGVRREFLYPSSNSLESIAPGKYRLIYTDKNVTKNFSMDFKVDRIYCFYTHVMPGGNMTTDFFHIATLPYFGFLFTFVTACLESFGRAILLTSLFFFAHTESPSSLRSIPFTIVNMLTELSTRIMNTITFFSQVNGVWIMTLSFLFFAFSLVLLNIAVHSKFSKNALKN